MEHSPSSSAEGLPTRFINAAARTRYQTIKRLFDLGWLRFGKQAAQANLSYAREFYAYNAEGNDAVNIRGRMVPAKSVTINTLLDLPDNLASIYELI
ncbi:hypothetical protein V6N12_010153 [Hibiscus sabdariffa]|uniref:Uncharacterized protein n=1 Tax=Hibiscus sabdariffa TaxID=183260 RepID=A0ABR2ECU5_9ROSI